jgi:hypothetical protein
MFRASPIVVVALLAGCSLLDDAPSVLTGAWGGPNMLIVGSPAGATVQMQCERVTFAVPLRLDQQNGFVATSTYSNPEIVGGAPQPVRLIVTPARDTALVVFQIQDPNGQWEGNDTFRVLRGQPVSYPDGRICG